MKHFSKVAGINLTISLIYFGFLFFSNHFEVWETLFDSIYFVGILFAINLIGGFVLLLSGKSEIGKALLLTASVIAMIGYSVCTFGFMTAFKK